MYIYAFTHLRGKSSGSVVSWFHFASLDACFFVLGAPKGQGVLLLSVNIVGNNNKKVPV